MAIDTSRIADFLPANTTPEVRKAFINLIARVKNLETSAVTQGDIDDAVSNITTGGSTGDANPPLAPSNLEAEKHENRVRLTWSNSASSDCAGTYIYRSINAGAVTLIAVATYPQRIFEDIDVTPFNDYRYYIQAVDDSGNVSDRVPAVDDSDNTVLASDLPAPDAVLANTWNGDDLNIHWDPVDGFGVAGYRVEIVGRRTADVVEPRFNYTFAMNEADALAYSVVVNVWTIGSDGSLSEFPATATFTHTTPSVVIGASTGVVDAGFTLSWSKPSDASVIGYDIALNGSILETGYTTETYLYKSLLLMGSYQFQVRSRNKFGQVSSWNTQIRVVHGPYAPSNISAKVIDNTVMLYWEAPATIELPIVEYEIRRGDLWAPGNVIGRKQGTFTLVQEMIAGSYQYMIAAVDAAGNVGETASVTVYVNEPPDYVLNVEWEDDFLNGTSTNVLVLDDGTAIAPYNVGQTWEEKFIGNGTVSNPQFTSFQDFIDAGYVYLPEPVPATAEFYEEHDYGAVLKTSSVALALDKTDFRGGPNISMFIGVKEALDDSYAEFEAEKTFQTDFRYVRDRYELTSDGTQFAVMTRHNLRLDSKLKRDAGKSAVTDAAAGIYVEFKTTFVDVQSVNVTAISNLYQGIVDFEDIPYPAGFTVYLVNATGVFMTGNFMWEAAGY